MARRDNVRLGVVAAAFLAVLREGLEAALFLVAAATDDDGSRVLVGGLLGLAVAMVAGWVVVVGGKRMPMKQFFTITGVLLIVFAAGLLARAVAYLQSAGAAMVLTGNAYDVTRYETLTTGSEVGKFLAAMTGWDPRPSWLQVVVWALYMVVVSSLFLRRTAVRPAAPSPSPAPAGAAPETAPSR